MPKLKIKKDWAEGLDPQFTDSYVMTSMFDHKSDYNNRDKYERSYGDNDKKQPLFSKDKTKNSGAEEKESASVGAVKDASGKKVGLLTT